MKLSDIHIEGITPETANKIDKYLKTFSINWERYNYKA
jgi:hypothetical protein